MSRMVNAAVLAGLLTLVSAANAPGWAAEATPLSTAAQPQWLNSTASGLYLGPDGFSHVTQSETSAKLGAGLNAGFFSSQYTMPANTVTALEPMGKYSLGSPALSSGARIGPLSGLNTSGFNTGIYAGGAQSFSTFGGQVTKDLGGGLLVNFVGAATRDPAGGYALGPHGSLAMNPGGQISTTAGAGMTMDFGGGSSFSLSGSVTRGNGRCAAMINGLCR